MSGSILKKKKCFPCVSKPSTTHIISRCVQFYLLSSLFKSGEGEQSFSLVYYRNLNIMSVGSDAKG